MFCIGDLNDCAIGAGTLCSLCKNTRKHDVETSLQSALQQVRGCRGTDPKSGYVQSGHGLLQSDEHLRSYVKSDESARLR